MTNFNIEIVSDTVCPWCYIGKKRLEKGIADYKSRHAGDNDTFTVTWKPYYLDPEAPAQGVDKTARRERKFGPQRARMIEQRLAEAGSQVGIAFEFGGKTGNTRDSHRLISLAAHEGPGAQDRVVDKLFEAYFEREQDITSHAVLLKAAVDAGLDQAKVKGWLAGDEGGREVDREVGQAQRRFISGVPHFTINGTHEVHGADDASVFVEAFERARET